MVHHLLTVKDYMLLLRLGGLTDLPTDIKYSETDVDTCITALKKQGFLDDESFTKKGAVVVDAIIKPGKKIIVNVSGSANDAVYRYFFKRDIWIAVAFRENGTLVDIIAPIAQEQIWDTVRETVLGGQLPAATEPGSIFLTRDERMIVAISSLVLLDGLGLKNLPQSRRERALYLSTLLGESAESAEVLLDDLLSDQNRTGEALSGAVRKGLFVQSEGGFVHSELAHRWLTPDSLLFKVDIQPDGEAARSFRVTKNGVLSITEQGDGVELDTQRDVDLSPFGLVAPVPEPEPEIAKPFGFCTGCGHSLSEGDAVCPECGKPVNPPKAADKPERPAKRRGLFRR